MKSSRKQSSMRKLLELLEDEKSKEKSSARLMEYVEITLSDLTGLSERKRQSPHKSISSPSLKSTTSKSSKSNKSRTKKKNRKPENKGNKERQTIQEDNIESVTTKQSKPIRKRSSKHDKTIKMKKNKSIKRISSQSTKSNRSHHRSPTTSTRTSLEHQIDREIGNSVPRESFHNGRNSHHSESGLSRYSAHGGSNLATFCSSFLKHLHRQSILRSCIGSSCIIHPPY